MADNNLISVSDAADLLAAKIANRPSVKVGSFEEFTTNIFSQNFDHPEWFKLWHICYMCNTMQRAWEDHKNVLLMAARGSLKTTVGAFSFLLWTFLSSLNQSKVLSSMYLTYIEPLAQRRLRELREIIKNNEQLSEWMIDKEPDAEYIFRYTINNKLLTIDPGGVFSSKRGLHVSRTVICDDILRDPANPLNFTQLDKVESRFHGELYNIPTGELGMRVVIGTPMTPDDLLVKLQSDSRFVPIILPAFNPKPNIRILCPEIPSFRENELLEYQSKRPREFASEMMMMPYSTANSYIKEEILSKCENVNLQPLDPFKKHEFDENDFIVAGVDVGNRVDPTHVVIYKINETNKKMVQIYQEVIREMMPSDVKDYMNMLSDNFSITRGYWDATRGELEDRGLESCWRGHIFGIRNKSELAQNFEQLLRDSKIEMILDIQQHAQILSVNGSLQAARTGGSHGEAFSSNILAVRAYKELIGDNTTQIIGNVQDLAKAWEENIPSKTNIIKNKNIADEDKCPNCGESAGWVKENTLCIICNRKFPNGIDIPVTDKDEIKRNLVI